MTHSLRCKKVDAYPSVLGRLNCHTERGLGYLHRQRDLQKEYIEKNKEELAKKAIVRKEDTLAKLRDRY